VYWLAYSSQNMVYSGSEHRLGQDYKIGIWCFCANHNYGVWAKSGGTVFMIICPSGATCLPADCSFSELAL